MKTKQLLELIRGRIALLVAMLLLSFVLQGQTYRILKASNDVSTYSDRAEISTVLSSNDLDSFKILKSTSLVIGCLNDQEYNLSGGSSMSLRSRSAIPYFLEHGAALMNANQELKMVVLDVSFRADLDSLSSAALLLAQFSSVKYLVIHTLPELYPSISPEMYDAEGLSLVAPAITEQLNALYAKGIKVFIAAIDPK